MRLSVTASVPHVSDAHRPAGHVVVVAAHPDDESLWIGGTLLRLRDLGVQLTILSPTCANHPVRRPEFEAACQVLRAKPIMLDHPIGWAHKLGDFAPDLDAIVNSASTPVDLVMTHAHHGNEHWHPQHRCCYRITRRWARRRRVPFAVFSERPMTHLPNGPVFIETELVSGRKLGAIWRRHIGAKGELIRNMVKARRLAFSRGLRSGLADGFPDARAWLQIKVNIEQKRQLCSAHESQMAGLVQYKAISNTHEYIYLNDFETAQWLAAKLGGG
jgi:LmbE family N-acetylglucosaminyl deacetylase